MHALPEKRNISIVTPQHAGPELWKGYSLQRPSRRLPHAARKRDPSRLYMMRSTAANFESLIRRSKANQPSALAFLFRSAELALQGQWRSMGVRGSEARERMSHSHTAIPALSRSPLYFVQGWIDGGRAGDRLSSFSSASLRPPTVDPDWSVAVGGVESV